MLPLLVLFVFLTVVGFAVYALFRHEQSKELALRAVWDRRVNDFAQVLNGEVRKNLATFDLSASAERHGIEGDVAAEAATKVYRETCRGVLADDVVTPEEEAILCRLGDALDLDERDRTQLLEEARLQQNAERRRAEEREQAENRAKALRERAEQAVVASIAPVTKEAKTSGEKRVRPRHEPRQKKRPGGETIRSKVSGVSFHNPDGSSRQKTIRKYCHPEQSLLAIREPHNEYDDCAIGLWVSTPYLWFFERKRQIGYVRGELAEDLAPLVDEGKDLLVRISDVTGGTRGKSYGVNIEISVRG